jgi:hypothetical protein
MPNGKAVALYTKSSIKHNSAIRFAHQTTGCIAFGLELLEMPSIPGVSSVLAVLLPLIGNAYRLKIALHILGSKI